MATDIIWAKQPNHRDDAQWATSAMRSINVGNIEQEDLQFDRKVNDNLQYRINRTVTHAGLPLSGGQIGCVYDVIINFHSAAEDPRGPGYGCIGSMWLRPRDGAPQPGGDIVAGKMGGNSDAKQKLTVKLLQDFTEYV
mmetsp:Transcript_57713/g.118047  ORF Transcript_57713/g.118047 Transcript_57713/m.118047 type:complete len:138 (+) Transcript_57713:259-672(+)|eukprot:CAMPEP_0181327506 /NCGR_PEP_ID=MMETSP1101-20121128/22142_1 /TAXON_ID=46948 /ORGANISM="Rhodomonas abbreviata, Strain Caron Lab Isolate" /LENGTH=137 /DNA_ID=CAMNT_0023436179 /DNA_START=239 /DNA_END=652 /DNA_ORIENTATION=+